METLILRGDSASKAELILKLAKELNFFAKKLSPYQLEEIGLAISIDDGMNSGILSNEEKTDFLNSLDE